MNKSLRPLAPLLLLIGALALPAPAYATSVNVAGRPIEGNINTGHAGSCTGIAYGRVDGALVMFLPNHCRYHGDPPVLNSQNEPGDSVMGPTGVSIGTWAAIHPEISQHDLTYFWVNAAGTPPNANRIYRGFVSGSNFWTITAQPSSGLGCDDASEWAGDDAFEMNQSSSETTFPYRYDTGTSAYLRFAYKFFYNYADGSVHCGIKTNNLYVRWNVRVESGNPVMKEAQSARLFGYVTDWGDCFPASSEECNVVTPMYDAIKAADDHWENDGLNKGAYFCIDAACTEQP